MSFYETALSRWRSIAKPLGGLGLLEDYVCRIAEIQQTEIPEISSRVLAVFCADNGIVEEKVSQTDSSVTRIVAENLTKGKTSVCKMAQLSNCDVFGVDCGIFSEKNESPLPALIDMRVRNGTDNFLKKDAMTRAECETAIQNGMDLAAHFKSRGYKIFATGEMGIGNTTTSSAVLASLLELDPSTVTGKGAGLSEKALSHKIEVIESAIKMRNPRKDDAIDVLSKVGGLDIATMCGFFIGGAENNVPCIIDGFISGVAALCAAKICPSAKKSMLASHVSSERAGKIVLDELGLFAPICAGMHLGEGSGCMALLPLLDMAFKVFYEMPTFDDIKIKAYELL